MVAPVFDFDKSLNAMLYIANRIDRRDIHKIFKILYFADMSHLDKYGRAITGDRYMAMKFGPVPSSIYDMVKIVRGDTIYCMDELKAFFKVDKMNLLPLRDADTEILSETDIRELDDSIAKYKDLSFPEMTLVSHGSAWEKAWNNNSDDYISIEDILTESGAEREYIDYVLENITAQKELNR